MPDNKLGLVLSGGGAKGAYQLGVLKALDDMKGIQINSIAGASIGALNGGVVVSAPSISEGIDNLSKVWDEIANDSPLKFKKIFLIKLLLLAGFPTGKLMTLFKALFTQNELDEGFAENSKIKELLDQYITNEGLSSGIPLYVSVYKSQGAIVDAAKYIFASFTAYDTSDSEYLCIQETKKDEQKKLLLASSALPLIFQLQKINKQKYSDGGQGGMKYSTGNTPAEILMKNGCKTIIVTHLVDGSLWSRHKYSENYKDVNIIEIRPQKTIHKNLTSTINFNKNEINNLIEQGYEDTNRCMQKVMAPVIANRVQKKTEEQMIKDVFNDNSSQLKMQASMAKIRA